MIDRSESGPAQIQRAAMPATLILLGVMVAFALVGFRLFNGLRTMQLQLGFGAILLRYESPSLFWLAIALQRAAEACSDQGTAPI